jgi:1-acyl-sn-glycerol-3-phosphate acyltransferase
MSRRLRQLWRTCRGALGFAAFGALALGLSFLVLPVDRWLRPEGAELRAQRWLHRSSRLFLRCVEALGILHLEVRGAERLKGVAPRVVVANHPTLFDVVLLCSILPQMDCVVNPSWARSFFLRGLTGSAGYVRRGGARAVVRECARRLGQGRSLLVFPEGTRSPRGGIGPFHRGAAHIALVASAPLVPILIRCDPPIQSKGQKWYDLAARPVRVTIRVRDEIPSRPLVESGVGLARASRELNRELRENFEKGLELVDAGT